MKIVTMAILLGLVIAGCQPSPSPSPVPGGGITSRPFTCNNGMEATGATTSRDRENCIACDSTYILINNRCDIRTEYTCDGGVPQTGMPPGNNYVERCASCDTGSLLTGSVCATDFPFLCDNGLPVSGTIMMFDRSARQNCMSCNTGYTLTAGGAGMICNRLNYSCDNGTPSTATPTMAGQTFCTACDLTYELSATSPIVGTTCNAVPLGEARQVGDLAAGFGLGLVMSRGLTSIGDTLYMIAQSSVDTGALYTINIDPTDGSPDGMAYRVGNAINFGQGTGLTNTLKPRALGALGTTLYITGSGNFSFLYTLNTTNGIATRVGSVDAGFGVGERLVDGLAGIDSTNTLYMVGESLHALFTINVDPTDGSSDGMAYRVGPRGFGRGFLNSYGLGAVGNTLYLSRGGGLARLYTLDTTTGTAAQVGSLGAGFGMVNEEDPQGLTGIGTILYMLGNDNRALYVIRTAP